MATIAISGKGGSGKTTIAAMIVRHLSRTRGRAVLAVDADPNACLGMALDVDPVGVVSQLRENVTSKKPANVGMDKMRSFEYGLQQVLTEAEGFDLLTMGRPEGPGCYCSANNILRTFLDKLSSQYQYVVIDNEAGMEHLSRRTNGSIDALCIVAEPNPVGEVTAGRISELARQLPISIRRVGVIWNKSKEVPELGDVEVFGAVPRDDNVLAASAQGRSIFDLDDSSPALTAVRGIVEEKLQLTNSLTAEYLRAKE